MSRLFDKIPDMLRRTHVMNWQVVAGRPEYSFQVVTNVRANRGVSFEIELASWL